ncbi:toxin-antitoxin system YwqK family antitoxin [Gracilimonas sp. BCB1]|uniref:toxin-antitoxin system YwqK family antitoxin n=1 Tax=Gracilimonas sp. BCB1 TaxID=3152362 RepID=UPI0032D96AC8
MKARTTSTLSIFTIFCVIALGACSAEKQKEEHYFLDGYDHLEFRDSTGVVVPPNQYIGSYQLNGVRMYDVIDTTLVLHNTRSGEPYRGFIRTFDSRDYNLQGEFENGEMFRLRYWYASRRLGMDADYRKQTGSIWDKLGRLAISWNPDELYFIDPASQKITQIRTDTMTSYYDKSGNLTSYTVRTDTSFVQYYADGQPRFKFPYSEVGPRSGKVMRWHPNGQIQVTGQYKDGEQSGVWIEYDSLGNEIKRESYN